MVSRSMKIFWKDTVLYFMYWSWDSDFFFQLLQKGIKSKDTSYRETELARDKKCWTLHGFCQLLNLFRKFEKITIHWMVLFTLRTNPCFKNEL